MSDQIPVQCVVFQNQIDNLNAQIENLQEELQVAAPVDKSRIIAQIGLKERALQTAEDNFDECIVSNNGPDFKPVPPATIPYFNNDPALQPVTKQIPWSLLQKKFDEFLNHRTDPPIFKMRLHHHDYIPPGQFSPDNNPPASDITAYMLEAVVVNGVVSTEYKSIFSKDLGQLPAGYYFNDFNTSSIAVALDPSSPEPITAKISFECSGPEEISSTTFGIPNFDLVQFDISLKLSFDVLRIPVAPPTQCADLKTRLDDLNNQLEILQNELENAGPPQKPGIIKQIVMKEAAIGRAEDELAACIITYGGPDPHLYGRLEFLSWVDKIANLQDDAFDEALKKYVVDHVVTTGALDPDGTFQKAIRNGIYNALRDPATRLAFNSTISRWILGGTGLYDVTSCVNDGQNVTVNYLVPNSKLDPFPDSIFRPRGWPYLNNPNADPSIDFSIPSNLSNIKHIVVLTMENRSFDHMLGYLSLPVGAGGMGRRDVDGLKEVSLISTMALIIHLIQSLPVIPHSKQILRIVMARYFIK